MANLFSSQTPSVTDASDGTPGITTATTVRFLAAGTVTGVRFYATATVGGTYTVMLYQVTAADSSPAGTLLATKTMGGSPTGGTWNSVAFDTPVSVVTSTLYRACLFSGAGRYVATTAFFTGALTNGNIVGDSNGDNPVGLGTLNQGVFAINASAAYPSTVASAASYFVDVDFTVDSGDKNTFPAGIAVPVALGAPTAAFTSTALVPTGISVPVALGSPTVTSGSAVAPGGISVPVALGAPTVALSVVATPTSLNRPVLLGAPTTAFTSTALVPTGISVPVALGAPSIPVGAGYPAGISVPVALGSPEVASIAAPSTGGNWNGYLVALNSARADAKVNAERRRNPVECPYDGWPLEKIDGVYHCLFGGHVITPAIF